MVTAISSLEFKNVYHSTLWDLNYQLEVAKFLFTNYLY